LTLQSDETSPIASFKSEAGREYFFQVDYEHVATATSVRTLKVSLSMQPSIAGVDELREETIDQNKLTEILSKSNLDGLEPAHPTAVNTNRKPAETSVLAVVSRAIPR
jgi:hypothetical protein